MEEITVKFLFARNLGKSINLGKKVTISGEKHELSCKAYKIGWSNLYLTLFRA
jgi:hypothetical protein